jgi:hypothetical protein
MKGRDCLRRCFDLITQSAFDDLKVLLTDLDNEQLQYLAAGARNFGGIHTERFGDFQVHTVSLSPPFDSFDSSLENILASLKWLSDNPGKTSESLPVTLAHCARHSPQILYCPSPPAHAKESWLLSDGVLRSALAVVDGNLLDMARAAQRQEVCAKLPMLWERFSNENHGVDDSAALREAEEALKAVADKCKTPEVQFAYASVNAVAEKMRPSWLKDYKAMSYSGISGAAKISSSTVGEWLNAEKKLENGPHEGDLIFRKWRNQTYPSSCIKMCRNMPRKMDL